MKFLVGRVRGQKAESPYARKCDGNGHARANYCLEAFGYPAGRQDTHLQKGPGRSIMEMNMHKTLRSFRHKGVKRFYRHNDRRGVPADQVKRLRFGLTALEGAERVSDLEVMPGWQLHRLNGEFEGYWSIRVNGNWRLVFRFDGGYVCDLDLIDYH